MRRDTFRYNYKAGIHPGSQRNSSRTDASPQQISPWSLLPANNNNIRGVDDETRSIETPKDLNGAAAANSSSGPSQLNLATPQLAFPPSDFNYERPGVGAVFSAQSLMTADSSHAFRAATVAPTTAAYHDSSPSDRMIPSIGVAPPSAARFHQEAAQPGLHQGAVQQTIDPSSASGSRRSVWSTFTSALRRPPSWRRQALRNQAPAQHPPTDASASPLSSNLGSARTEYTMQAPPSASSAEETLRALLDTNLRNAPVPSNASRAHGSGLHPTNSLSTAVASDMPVLSPSPRHYTQASLPSPVPHTAELHAIRQAQLGSVPRAAPLTQNRSVQAPCSCCNEPSAEWAEARPSVPIQFPSGAMMYLLPPEEEEEEPCPKEPSPPPEEPCPKEPCARDFLEEYRNREATASRHPGRLHPVLLRHFQRRHPRHRRVRCRRCRGPINPPAEAHTSKDIPLTEVWKSMNWTVWTSPPPPQPPRPFSGPSNSRMQAPLSAAWSPWLNDSSSTTSRTAAGAPAPAAPSVQTVARPRNDVGGPSRRTTPARRKGGLTNTRRAK